MGITGPAQQRSGGQTHGTVGTRSNRGELRQLNQGLHPRGKEGIKGEAGQSREGFCVGKSSRLWIEKAHPGQLGRFRRRNDVGEEIPTASSSQGAPASVNQAQKAESITSCCVMP